MKTIIFNGNIISNNSIIQKGYIRIENGIIMEIGSGWSRKKSPVHENTKGIQWIDAEGGYVCPGFIDLHVHGVGICDIYANTAEGLVNMKRVLASQGVTSFLPTLITLPEESIIKIVTKINSEINLPSTDGANILGVNIEGPYINPANSGAQPVENIRKPDKKEIKRIIEASKGTLKIMTIAPEIPGNLEIAKILKDNGVIAAIGHTKATFEETMKSIDSGVTYISHTFNAMTPFHHREPGAIGAIFMREEVVTEIISDGVHVHPAVIKFLCQIKKHENIILVTDALSGLMRRGDRGMFAGREVTSDGYGGHSSEGILMGSVTPMNRAIKNIMKYTDIDLKESLKFATINPAVVLGLEQRKGTLETGKDADIIIMDQDYRVNTTMVGGKIV